MRKKGKAFCMFCQAVGYALLLIYLIFAFMELFASCYKGDHKQLYEIMLFISIVSGATFLIKLIAELIFDEDFSKIVTSIIFIILWAYNFLSNIMKLIF